MGNEVNSGKRRRRTSMGHCRRSPQSLAPQPFLKLVARASTWVVSPLSLSTRATMSMLCPQVCILQRHEQLGHCAEVLPCTCFFRIHGLGVHSVTSRSELLAF